MRRKQLRSLAFCLLDNKAPDAMKRNPGLFQITRLLSLAITLYQFPDSILLRNQPAQDNRQLNCIVFQSRIAHCHCMAVLNPCGFHLRIL